MESPPIAGRPHILSGLSEHSFARRPEIKNMLDFICRVYLKIRILNGGKFINKIDLTGNEYGHVLNILWINSYPQ